VKEIGVLEEVARAVVVPLVVWGAVVVHADLLFACEVGGEVVMMEVGSRVVIILVEHELQCGSGGA